MTDAPERIMIDPDYKGFAGQIIGYPSNPDLDDWPEYIREDIYDAALKREAKLRKALNKCVTMANGWR